MPGWSAHFFKEKRKGDLSNITGDGGTKYSFESLSLSTTTTTSTTTTKKKKKRKRR